MSIRQLSALSMFSLAILAAPLASPAAQFSVVGPRALGMGGAGVAAVNDSTAVYWNPAALAQYHRLDIRIPAEVAFRDHMDLKNTWSDANDIYDLAQAGDPTALLRLALLMTRLAEPDTGADLDGSTGLFASIPLPASTLAVSALGLGYVGMFPTADLFNLNPAPALPADSVLLNSTTITGTGISTVQPAVSFAISLGGKIYLGASAKMILADTYVNSDYMLNPLQSTSGDWNDFFDNLDKSKTSSSQASLDAGIVFAPVESFSIGVVARDLNSPAFPVKGLFAYPTGIPIPAVTFIYTERQIELKPQVRTGIAWHPYPSLTLAADYDITKNKTLVPGYEDQTLALGLEQTVLGEHLSLRAGAYQNLADSRSNIVYTAGLGTRILAFRLDLAGAYDFDEKEYQVSLNLALRF